MNCKHCQEPIRKGDLMFSQVSFVGRHDDDDPIETVVYHAGCALNSTRLVLSPEIVREIQRHS